MINTHKIGIIGVGHVGAHVAYCALLQGLAAEIYLCDIDEKKLLAETRDLSDCLSLASHNVKIVNCGVNYEKLAGCDIIVNAAGNINLTANGRDAELFETTAIAKTFVSKIVDAGFDGIFVSVANPCDVVATEIFHLTNYDPKKIIGSGCVLDSSRLKHDISKMTGVSTQSIDAYMIGEHGRSEIAAWSCVRIAGKSIYEFAEENPEVAGFDLSEIENNARLGGRVVYEGKNCTEFAIGLCVVEICSAILRNEHRIMCVSSMLDGQFGEKGIFASLPCQIGTSGIERVFTPNLTESEISGFKSSCAHIKDNISKLDWW